MVTRWVAVLLGTLGIVFAACGDTTTTPSGDGVCCPNSASAGMCSASNLPSGGWAASSSECSSHTLSFADGCPTVAGTDSHGCAYVNTGGISCANPCGQIRRDAGPDATADASGEGGADGSTDAAGDATSDAKTD